MENKSKATNTAVRSEKLFSHTLTAAFLAVVIIINVLLYILNLNLGAFYIVPGESDPTELSGATDELFAAAGEEGAKVKIRFCMAEDELKTSDTGMVVYSTAKKYEQRYPSLIELDYINVIRMVDKDGKPVDFEKYTKDETAIRTNTVIIECGENFEVITDAYSSSGFVGFYTTDAKGNAISYDGEAVFAGMISRVLRGVTKKAYLTVGHTEQIDPAFSKLLLLAGYESDTISLSEKAVPDDCDLLIISSPRTDFETAGEDSKIPYATTETGRLEAYLKRGGNLYVTLDPYVKELTALEGVLENCGISLSTSELEGDEVRDIVKDTANAITTDGYTIVAEHAEGEVANKIAELTNKYNTGRVIAKYLGALHLTGTAEPLLVSSSSAVCQFGETVTRDDGNFAVAAYNKFSYDGATEKATVFVCSSIYLTVSSALVTNGYSNRDFVFAVFDELFGLEGLPYGTESVVYDSGTLENLTMSTANLYTFIAFLVPMGIAILGVVIIVRRKNR